MRKKIPQLLSAFLLTGLLACSSSESKNQTSDSPKASPVIRSTTTSTTLDDLTMPTTSSTIRLEQTDHFENSSPWGGITELTANNLLLYVSETGIYYNDIDEANGHWKRVTGYEDGYHGVNAPGGSSSAVSDPANPDVIYFCSGSTGLFGSSGNIDAFTYTDLGFIFRSDDNLQTVKTVAGKTAWERLVVGCPEGSYSRYIIETEPDPDIEMWVMPNHGPLFAIDDRQTITASTGKTISSSFYYNTHDKGLYRAVYNSDGTSLTWTSIDMAPKISDDGSTGGIYTYAGFSQDFFRYDYAPQSGTVDYRTPYAQDGSGNCDQDTDGDGEIDIYGDDDGSGGCIEDEHQGVGTAVIFDPVNHAYQKSVGENSKAVLWTGYFVQPVWPHGGLRRVFIDSTGAATSEEITYDDGSGPISLDVRDISCDETQKTTITTPAAAYASVFSSGEEISKYCYVAAGRNGAFKLTLASDGSVGIEAINTSDGSFTFTTRDDYMASCSGSACTDTVSYQAADIDQVYVEGVSTLLLVTSSNVYYATDDFSNPIQWHNISGPGRAWAGVIDPTSNKIYMGSGGELESLSLDHLTDSDLPWTEIPGFADRSGFRTSFDAIHENWVHYTDLDGTYGYLKLDGDNEVTEELPGGGARDAEIGNCYGMAYGDVATLDADSSGNLDAAATGEFRYNSYGDRVLWANDATTGAKRMYVASNHFSAGDGAIHECSWSDAGALQCTLATGDHGCVNTYPFGNWAHTSCIAICDSAQSPNALPSMSMGSLAVDPNNADHLVVIGSDGTTNHMYESTDGGDNWTNRDASYIYYDGTTPYALSALGNVVDIIWDPIDSNAFYVSYYSRYGIFKANLSGGYFTDISNLDISADNNANSTTLGTYTGATYNTLGTSKYYMPFSRNMEAIVDPTTGQTRLYLAVSGFCDGGWGLWPEVECGTINGGGIYTRLINSDPAQDATTYWTKLNTADSSLRYFMAYDLAVSPVDPNYIVAVGSNDFGWGSGGNPAGLTAGIIYTTDGGVTWARVTNEAVNSAAVAADPFDKTKFAISLLGQGLWILDLDTTIPALTSGGGSSSGGSSGSSGSTGSMNPTDTEGNNNEDAPADDDEDSGNGGWFFGLWGAGCQLRK